MIGAVLYSLINPIIQIYPLRGSQGKTLPLATYQVLMNEPTNHIGGLARNRRVEIQVNVVGPVYDDIQTKAFQIISALDRYTGAVGGEIIKDIRHTGGPDDLYQDDSELFGVAIDFTIWTIQN
jgi:hypothetical protein